MTFYVLSLFLHEIFGRLETRLSLNFFFFFNMTNASSVTFRLLNEILDRDQSFLRPDVKIENFCWRPSKMDMVKVNFDGAFCVSSHIFGAGVVIHNWRDTFIHASRECFNCVRDS